jgi:uncharacterized protein YaiI (UPF0178 family)
MGKPAVKSLAGVSAGKKMARSVHDARSFLDATFYAGGNKTMNLLIDADACPVIDIALRIASAFHVPAVLFCDSAHVYSRQDAQVVTVMRGADSADFTLVNRVIKGDIVITQDYGLAAMCLAKGAYVLRQDGLLYTEENILQLLSQRHETKKRLRSGERVKGPKKRDSKQDESFAVALHALMAK